MERVFNQQIVFTTARLTIKLMDFGDAQALYDLLADAKVVEFDDSSSLVSVEQGINIIYGTMRLYEEKKAARWSIFLRDFPTMIGTIGFYLDGKDNLARIGYNLRSAFWRQGIMKEALFTISTFLLNNTSLNRLEALVMPENIPSAKLLESLKFHYEGLLREYLFFKGSFHDMHCYSLLKKDLKEIAK